MTAARSGLAERVRRIQAEEISPRPRPSTLRVADVLAVSGGED